ncbi:calcium-binding protein [Kordiimonas sp. SCSIO 12610]|uniref:beta strand repeat-containing protein n=1 Tax=Kordiimonas sp. SCSIO 12610 TaxID=2829597 RepID=UPI0022002A51|nr:calcium-binding protein [Kordiimonas sp. SCSIO 12610]UTW56215.1 hypothetical protein KFF44_04765 [Kordiimonas sp. SCSIO 12610]
MATIVSTSSDETLTGTAASDTFIFADDHGFDIINEFDPSSDVIDLSALTTGFNSFADILEAASDISPIGVIIDTGVNSNITIGGVSIADLSASNFIFSTITGRVIDGTDGNDTLEGDLGDDTISGGAGNDTLFGNGGDDVFIGGAGNDVFVDLGPVTGGTDGDNRYVFADDHGFDIINEFDPSSDVIDLSALTTGFNSFADVRELAFQNGNDVEIFTGASGSSIFLTNVNLSDLSASNFIFSTITGRVIDGTSGNDTLEGDLGDDTISGGAGNDSIDGVGGVDVINGGAGDDTISGFGSGSRLVFEDGHGLDVVQNFNPSEDIIDLSALTTGFNSFDDVLALSSGFGGDVRITTSAAGSEIFLQNVNLADLSASNFIFSANTGQVIDGTSGNDTLEGDLGDDTISGGAGNDSIDGLGGADVINGGAGDDTIYALDGTRVVFEDGHGIDEIRNFNRFEDIIDLSALTTGFNSFDDVLELTSQFGANVHITTSAAGSEIILRNVRVSELSASNFIFASSSGRVIDGTDGNDTLEGDFGDDTITGGAGNDTLIGGGGDGVDVFVITPGNGFDVIQDFDSNDIIDLSQTTTGLIDFDAVLARAAGSILDTDALSHIDLNGFDISLLTPANFIFATTDELIFRGSDGDDDFIGESDLPEVLLGLGGNDTISEFSTGDTVRGGAGDDLISNGILGNSLIDGGSGNDTLQGVGNDTIIGGAGDDDLSTLGADNVFVFAGNHGNDTITITIEEAIIDLSATTNNLIGLDAVIDAIENRPVDDATQADLILRTSPSSTITFSQFSIDELRQIRFIFEGQSEVGVESNPGATNTPSPMSEPVAGTDADDTLDGGGGNDTVDGGDGNDSLSGGDGVDTVRGGAGNDRIDAGTGDDFVSGGTGDDTVAAGTGNDAVFAGAGDMGDDVFVGGEGRDTLGGGAGNDLLVGDGASSTSLSGLGVGDTGLDDRDTIFGGDGDDTLLGGGFDDTSGDGTYDDGEAVTTGTEANTLYAGTGADLVIGASGNDTIGGGLGDDTLNGGDGDDTFYGGRGDGTDTGFNDVINGGDGNDTIFSSGGRDLVNGGDGDDELFSGGAVDTVDGGAGNDTIYGGGDDDLFTGGTGADTFAFFDGNGNDTITDFNTSEDTLDLNGTETDFTDLASVQAAASNATQGGVAGLLIDTGTGDSIFLEGLTTADLASINIIF